MAFQLDAKFFRRAKKVNRAVELTDTQAFIPAVKDNSEIRVALPNRRLKTIDERTKALDERKRELEIIEESIELERKSLLEMVKSFQETGTGAAAVVAQNLKIKMLMEKRRPEQWIEDLEGLNFKDVFQSKRDVRKIGAPVYQIKRRVEPIDSLYVDLGLAAVVAEPVDATLVKPITPAKSISPAKPKTTEEAAKGAIIAKRIIKAKTATGTG